MSTPIPVPSKAAINALRGLALGTSCALGLIVEDRRRRISTLRTAIDNKKKLRTSRKYHGAAAEAISYVVDDAVILSGDELHWHHREKILRDSLHQRHVSCRPPSSEKEPAQDARNIKTKVSTTEPNVEFNTVTRAPKSTLQTTQKGRRPIPDSPPANGMPATKDSGGWATAPITQARTTPDQRIAEISDLPVSSITERLKQPGSFATYKAAFIAGCQLKLAFKKKLDMSWLKVSEVLCAHCHAEGLWLDAQELLAAVVRTGEIDEETFYAHGPMAIVDSMLSNLEVDGDSIAKQLHLAVRIFLAKFEQKPRLYANEVLSQGEKLISRLLQFNQIQLVHPVFWRILGQQERPEQFTAWFIQALFEYQDHKSVVKYFKVNFSKMSPDPGCFSATVQLVLESVEAMRGVQAEQVARALAKQCKTTDLQPQTGWIIKLLQTHWDRHKDLQMSREFFSELTSSGLIERIYDAGEVYQIMVKLSVLAADYQAALHYYHETVMLTPRMAKNVWLNGYMALMKAKTGDWDGVFNDFLRMRDHNCLQPKAYDQTFVAVLKVYIEGHTVAQVQDFIKLYMKEMDIRLHRYVVTLVANKYGALHDHEGFMQWLRYCASQGFAMDPAFSNAVLRNLRLKWKFSYQELRKMYSEIQKANPAAVDDVTTRIMHSAAMEEGNYAGKNTQHRLRVLGASPSKLPYHYRSANERDVLHAMTEELVRGNPSKVVVIYKRALRFGMPWCPKCFRVATKASLQRPGDNFGMTIKLITDSHENGHDVAPGVTVFIKAQINQFRGSFEDVMTNLQKSIIRFESLGVFIDASILTQTAIMSAQFKQFDRAVDLCKLAMEKSGATNPCFSKQSFRALLMAYWQTMDTAGLRWVVESLPSSRLAADKTVYQLLKSTKRHMTKWRNSPRVEEMYEILQSGIDQASQQRTEHIETGSRMYNETLRIMSDAAGAIDGDLNSVREGGKRWEEPQMTLVPDMRVEAYS